MPDRCYCRGSGRSAAVAVELTHSMNMMAQIKQIPATTQPPMADGSRSCAGAPSQGDSCSAGAHSLGCAIPTASK